MIRQRKVNRLRRTGVPFAILTALAESDKSMPLRVFQTVLANLVNSEHSIRGAKGQMFADGIIEMRVHITPLGLEMLAENQPRKKPCEKSARTVARKATSHTVVPVDSTPLAMAWMGRQ